MAVRFLQFQIVLDRIIAKFDITDIAKYQTVPSRIEIISHRSEA